MTRAPTPRPEMILDSLRGEFDALVERMQTGEAKAAGRALFTAYTRRPGAAVVADLQQRFDEVLAELEAAAGWQTSRVRRPVLILGQLDGVLTGIRQLRRVQPLETEEIAGLRLPTLAEMARIKAWLLATRFTVRDYLDAVVLFERLGVDGVRAALAGLDALYPQPNGASVLAEVVERLGSARPVDEAAIDLATYRGLRAPWNDWQHVASRGRFWARVLADLLLGAKGGEP